MSLALLATAATQALVTVVALLAGVPEDASVLDILVVNAMYVALFCLSAWLFRRAAEQDAGGGSHESRLASHRRRTRLCVWWLRDYFVPR